MKKYINHILIFVFFVGLSTTSKAQVQWNIGPLFSVENIDLDRVFKATINGEDFFKDYLIRDFATNQKAIGISVTAAKEIGLSFAGRLLVGLGERKTASVGIDGDSLRTFVGKSHLWRIAASVGYDLLSSSKLSLTPYIGLGLNGGRTRVKPSQLDDDSRPTEEEVLSNFRFGGILLDLSFGYTPGKLGFSFTPTYNFNLGSNTQKKTQLGMTLGVFCQL